MSAEAEAVRLAEASYLCRLLWRHDDVETPELRSAMRLQLERYGWANCRAAAIATARNWKLKSAWQAMDAMSARLGSSVGKVAA